MESHLTPEDDNKLLKLQEKCEICKEVIVHEAEAGNKLEMATVCEKCNKLRRHLPELMETKRRLMEANEKGE